MGLGGPFGIRPASRRLARQSVENHLNRIGREASVDRALADGDRRRSRVGGKADQDALYSVLTVVDPGERLDQGAYPFARHEMGRKAAIERIRRTGPGAGQPEIAAELSRAQVQKTRRADIG